jgi:hypothetical protein
MDFFVSFELFLLFLHYGLHVMGAAKAQDLPSDALWWH